MFGPFEYQTSPLFRSPLYIDGWLYFPFFLIINAEHSLHDGSHLKPSDNEGERFWSIRRQDLAVFYREIVQRIGHVNVDSRLLLEADELAVVLQDEVTGTPVANVFP